VSILARRIGFYARFVFYYILSRRGERRGGGGEKEERNARSNKNDNIIRKQYLH